MKLLRNFSLLVLLFSLVFVSCSKDDNKPSKTSHKVYFKAITSEGCNISVAVYGYDSKTTAVSALSGTSWTSPEIEVPAGTIVALATVSASGVDASSTLKVQVFVDGEMKDEGTGFGTALTANASFEF